LNFFLLFFVIHILIVKEIPSFFKGFTPFKIQHQKMNNFVNMVATIL